MGPGPGGSERLRLRVDGRDHVVVPAPGGQDFDIFFHGFYNAASLPRLIDFQSSSSNNSIPSINVVGVGAIWTVKDRLAVFGSYNFGTTTGSPHTIALTGFAVAF